MIINQRVEKEYFDHIAAGDKRDLRLANRAVRKGDTVILEEWDVIRGNIPAASSIHQRPCLAP